MKRYATLGILLVTGLLANPVHADEVTGRLKRIKDTATMVIAHGETAMPFSYVDGGIPVGFGTDIARRIAETIKIRLGLAELRIRWNPVTLSTRFPLITTNTVDLECIATTHTRDREQLAGFSLTFHVSDEGIASRRESGIKNYPDLAGKNVAVVRGTTTERGLLAKGINLTLIPGRSNRVAMSTLTDGRADAFVAAAPIIAGELLRLQDPRPFHITGSGGLKEAFACMLPKDDPAFKKVVDETLAGMMKSGEMERLYNKWFMSPIPPFGHNLNLQLTEDNRRLYQMPNDAPFD